MAVPKKKKSSSFTKIHRYSWLELKKKKRNNFLLLDKYSYKNSMSYLTTKTKIYLSFLNKI